MERVTKDRGDHLSIIHRMAIKKKSSSPPRKEYVDVELNTLTASVEEEQTVKHLLASLDFSPEDVVRAASSNPRLFITAGEYRIACLRRKSAADMNVDRIAAMTELEIRNLANERQEKVTENHVKALLQIDDVLTDAKKELAEADANDEWAKLLVEAYRMRRDVIEVIGRLTGNEMAYSKALEQQAETMEVRRRQLQNKYPGGS